MTTEKQSAQFNVINDLQAMYRETQAEVRTNKSKLYMLTRKQTIAKRKLAVLNDAIKFINQNQWPEQ